MKLCTSAIGTRNISQAPEAVMRQVKKVCEEEMLIPVAVKLKPSESGCSDQGGWLKKRHIPVSGI